MKILLAIPCYNCEKQVTRVFESLELLPELSFIESVIFIDNCSTDKTIDRLFDLRKKSALSHKVLVARNGLNYGLGGTHKVAFLHAIKNEYDGILILHGDDQADVSDIPELIRRVHVNKRTILGSRFMRDSILENYSWSRIFGNRFLNFLFTIATHRKTHDLGSGLNLFLTRDISKLSFLGFSNSFNFNVELLLGLYRQNIDLEYMPIHWRETDQTSNARNFSVAFSMLSSLRDWLARASQPESKFKEYKTQLL